MIDNYLRANNDYLANLVFFGAYPSLSVILNTTRFDILEIRPLIQVCTDKKDGQRYLNNVSWVISCREYVFTKNATWIKKAPIKTGKFIAKATFDSFENATSFAKKNWVKIIKPWVV